MRIHLLVEKPAVRVRKEEVPGRKSRVSEDEIVISPICKPRRMFLPEGGRHQGGRTVQKRKKLEISLCEARPNYTLFREGSSNKRAEPVKRTSNADRLDKMLFGKRLLQEGPSQ